MTEFPRTPLEVICYLNGGHQWEKRSDGIACRYCEKRKESNEP